jgi:hypothetical protein
MSPIIILYNNLCVNPGVFLVKKCPLKKATKCDPKDINQFLESELEVKDEEFEKKLDLSYIKLVQWIVKMNSGALVDAKLPSKDQSANTEFLKIRANLIITGLDMATELKRNVKNLILMYQICSQQPSKTRLHDIVRCIEMLKAIDIEFKTKRYLIN